MSDMGRWQNYHLASGSGVTELWGNLLVESRRRVLVIVGMGFDERMCLGVETLFRVGGGDRIQILAIAFDDESGNLPNELSELRDQNEQRLQSVAEASGAQIDRRSIDLRSNDGRRVGGRAIARQFSDWASIEAYTDVVVDVSSLPRNLYFPLLARLLSLFDVNGGGTSPVNLHALVAHAPAMDAAIQVAGIEDEATFLHGFSSAEFELEASRQQPRVWLPILGSGRQGELDRLVALVTPDEICPVLPSPAQNPREADNLLLEYRDFLFDQYAVEPRNIIYASEENPFEVYRQIVRSVRHYRTALASLGGCKVVISAMSSKLASLGGLLAAHELRFAEPTAKVDVGIAHVETQGYTLSPTPGSPPAVLYNLWLAGESYG